MIKKIAKRHNMKAGGAKSARDGPRFKILVISTGG